MADESGLTIRGVWAEYGLNKVDVPRLGADPLVSAFLKEDSGCWGKPLGMLNPTGLGPISLINGRLASSYFL